MYAAGVTLKVTFTPRYPKEAPKLEVLPLRNIDADSCASLQEQLDNEVRLLSVRLNCKSDTRFVHCSPCVLTSTAWWRAHAQALQNLDMAMVLTLAQMAKVRLRSLPLFLSGMHSRLLCWCGRTRAQEWLENIKDELARKAREREDRARMQELEEEQAQQVIQERKFQAGTPVNPTTFAGTRALTHQPPHSVARSKRGQLGLTQRAIQSNP
jgi:hypothetical protein